MSYRSMRQVKITLQLPIPLKRNDLNGKQEGNLVFNGVKLEVTKFCLKR